MMAPQVLSMIQILFPGHKERTEAMGWYGITIGIGTVLGQFLGGYFSSLTVMEEPWRFVFLINVPLIIPAVFFTIKILNESKASVRQSFNTGGVVILSAGLFCATYAFTLSEHEGFTFKNGSLMIISAGILFIFIKDQKKRIRNERSYLIDYELFQYKNFNLGMAAVSFFFIMLDSYFYILSLFFQNGLKISPLAAGEIIVFQGLGFILASVISVKLILKYGKKALMAGLLFIIAVLIFQLLLFRMEISFPVFYLLLFLHGLGIGSVIPSLATIALSGMPEKLTGNASGVYNTFQQIAAVIGIVAVGSIFNYFLGEKPEYQDYQNAFLAAILINILCIIVVIVCVFKVPDEVLPEMRYIPKK